MLTQEDIVVSIQCCFKENFGKEKANNYNKNLCKKIIQLNTCKKNSRKIIYFALKKNIAKRLFKEK